MKAIYLRFLAAVLLVGGLIAWRQSVMSMEVSEEEQQQSTKRNLPTEMDINNLTQLPRDMQKEILKNKPAHPALVKFVINKLCHPQSIQPGTPTIETKTSSPDGQYSLQVAFRNGATFVATSGQKSELIHMILHDDKINSVALSPDSTYALTGSDDKTANLWNTQSGTPGSVLLPFYTLKHDDAVKSVALSADSKYALTGSEDKTAKIWDTQSGQLLHTFNHNGSVNSVAFSPDGKYALTTSPDIKIWNMDCLNKLVK